ncbi:MAG: MFS transporter [Clostridiales bacterium]|nr:MFS transporter [Clostridiales bacterium]
MAGNRQKLFNKAEWSWIFYDWANSIYATNISAAIFPILYSQVAGSGTTADIMYGYAVSLANLLVALLAPYLGSIADFKGMKKKLWMVFLILGVAFTAVMGVFGSWQLMLLGFVISRIGFSGANLFYDSFLTDVTTPERMDKVSTWGFAMGYIGGSTIPFLISIAIMILMNMSQLSMRIAVLIVPVWWLVFSLPFIRNVHQVAFVDKPRKHLGKEAWINTIQTLKRIFKDKAVFFFLLAYFFYIDGVDTIISMSTKYGDTLGLGSIGMILALLVTQVVAMPCSILFGNLSKKIGALRLITFAVIMYGFITVIGFLMGFLVDFSGSVGLTPERAVGISQVLFWVLATLVGTVQGGIQALSRSYYGKLIPPERSGEYFGFMDIFGKFACVIGPALYEVFYSLSGKACFGILSIIILFILGFTFLKVGNKYFRAVEHE